MANGHPEKSEAPYTDMTVQCPYKTPKNSDNKMTAQLLQTGKEQGTVQVIAETHHSQTAASSSAAADTSELQARPAAESSGATGAAAKMAAKHAKKQRQTDKQRA